MRRTTAGTKHPISGVAMPKSSYASSYSSLRAALAALEAGSLSLGWNEAPTPLFRLTHTLWLKDEGRNQSGSWTDRVAAAFVTAARACGRTEIDLSAVCDLPAPDQNSLAVSLAIYAAQNGLGAKVALREPFADADFFRIRASGAQIVSNADTKAEEALYNEIDCCIDQAKRIAVTLFSKELSDQIMPQLDEKELWTTLWPTHDDFRVRGMLPAPATTGVMASVPRIALDNHDRSQATLDCWNHYAQGGRLLAPETATSIVQYEKHAATMGNAVIVNPRSALAASQELAAWTGLRHYPTRMPVGGIITPQ